MQNVDENEQLSKLFIFIDVRHETKSLVTVDLSDWTCETVFNPLCISWPDVLRYLLDVLSRLIFEQFYISPDETRCPMTILGCFVSPCLQTVLRFPMRRPMTIEGRLIASSVQAILYISWPEVLRYLLDVSYLVSSYKLFYIWRDETRRPSTIVGHLVFKPFYISWPDVLRYLLDFLSRLVIQTILHLTRWDVQRLS